MRGSIDRSILTEVMAVLGLTMLVGLLTLVMVPQDLHSLSHRKSDAIELLAQAQDLTDRENAVFNVLMVASSEPNQEQLRWALADNEMRFHQICLRIIETLPEARGQITELSEEFDLLSAAGWKAHALQREGQRDAARNALQTQFSPFLANLRAHLQMLDHSLHSSDRALDLGRIDGWLLRLWNRLGRPLSP